MNNINMFIYYFTRDSGMNVKTEFYSSRTRWNFTYPKVKFHLLQSEILRTP